MIGKTGARNHNGFLPLFFSTFPCLDCYKNVFDDRTLSIPVPAASTATAIAIATGTFAFLFVAHQFHDNRGDNSQENQYDDKRTPIQIHETTFFRCCFIGRNNMNKNAATIKNAMIVAMPNVPAVSKIPN